MIYVCPLSDLPPGEAVRLDVVPPVAVFRTDAGELYAIDDTCTHQDASLAEGWIEGCAVECPLHESRFDLRTGHADAPPATRPVRTHRVVVEADAVHVELSAAEPQLPPATRTVRGPA